MPAVHLSGPQNITFVHIPRTAGTSVGVWLMEHANQEGNTTAWFDHPTVSEIREICDVKFSFAVVRNPWARALSGYLFFSNIKELIERSEIGIVDARHTYLKYPDQKTVNLFKFILEGNAGYFKKPVSFEQFLDDSHSLVLPKGSVTKELSAWIPQTYWLDGGVDLVMKVENLQDDFKVIQEMFNTADPLPVLHTTAHDNYRKYYDDKHRKLIEKNFEEEIDLFKYTF